MACAFKRIPPAQGIEGRNSHACGFRLRFIAFVDSGLMRLFTIREGVDRTSEFIASGDFITDYHSFLTRTPSQQSISALTDCELRLIRYADLQALYIRHPVYEKLGRLVAENVFLRAVERFSAMINQKPEERYIRFIEQYPLIFDQIPQYMVATYVGVSPVGLSKIRKRLKATQKKSINIKPV